MASCGKLTKFLSLDPSSSLCCVFLTEPAVCAISDISDLLHGEIIMNQEGEMGVTSLPLGTLFFSLFHCSEDGHVTALPSM